MKRIPFCCHCFCLCKLNPTSLPACVCVFFQFPRAAHAKPCTPPSCHQPLSPIVSSASTALNWASILLTVSFTPLSPSCSASVYLPNSSRKFCLTYRWSNFPLQYTHLSDLCLRCTEVHLPVEDALPSLSIPAPFSFLHQVSSLQRHLSILLKLLLFNTTLSVLA